LGEKRIEVLCREVLIMERGERERKGEREGEREQCTGIAQEKHFPKTIDWENKRGRLS